MPHRRSVLSIAACYVCLVAPATANATVGNDGMPSQAQTDLSSTDPGNGSGQAGWGDMPGGVANRPYIQSLSVINDGVTTPVIDDGQPGGSGVGAGGLGAIISPLNLCRAGQAPTGSCYATPNRVGVTLAYPKGETGGWDFSTSAGQAVTPTVNANSVVDMTIALNTLGASLRWSWANGDLLYWQPANLGAGNATLRVKFKPVTTPWVTTFPPGNGCTATPIFDCNIQTADAEGLGANLVLSLDTTLDSALTGAVFATQGAINGFLAPGGTAQAPSLDMQVSSSHLRSDGSPQTGTLKAFLPAATLLNLYGLLPADARAHFTAARSGDAGTNDAPVFTPWTAAANGAEGLLVTVTGITFSVPEYQVKARLKKIVSKAKVARGRAGITATIAACTRAKPCSATVYDLGLNDTSRRFAATRTLVLKNARVRSRKLALRLPSRKLSRTHRYLLVVRQGRQRKLVASTTGVVS
jgi:hypothetical protein